MKTLTELAETLLEVDHDLSMLKDAYVHVQADEIEASQSLFDAQETLAKRQNILQAAKASAIAAQKIQTTKQGSNQAKRDAHERDYLKAQYTSVEAAEMAVKVEQTAFNQISSHKHYLRQLIHLTQTRASILRTLIEWPAPLDMADIDPADKADE